MNTFGQRSVSQWMLMKKSLLILALLPCFAHAALPGAWETFPTNKKAEDWTLFDYAYDQFYAPNWFTEGNPYIGASYAENANTPGLYDQGLWFFADAAVADGAFVGDFFSTEIQGIEVDVYVSEPTKLDYIDLVIGSDSNGSVEYYYSVSYFGSEFDQGDPDWFTLSPLFTDSWFVLNADGTSFEETQLTPEILSQVTEVGIRFIPTETNDTGWTPFFDNVALTPTPRAPELKTTSANDQLLIHFEQEAGSEYALETYNLSSKKWEVVTGEDSISGTGLHTIERMLIPSGEFYRVLATAGYTRVSE